MNDININQSKNEKRDQLYTKKEITKLLDIRVSAVDSWVLRRKIPFIKLGRLLRFKLDDVLAWLSKKRILSEGCN